MISRTFSSTSIVLKRRNVGEFDRVVTFLSRDQGKLTALAKGCRKMSSSRLSSFEPGNLMELFLVRTQAAPIVTQTKALWSSSDLRSNLIKVKQLSQVLEIVDTLFSEGQAEPELFDMVLEIIQNLDITAHSFESTRRKLQDIISALGYQEPQELGITSLSQYISLLAGKPLRSFEFLSVTR